jgi:hypothetical protein
MNRQELEAELSGLVNRAIRDGLDLAEILDVLLSNWLAFFAATTSFDNAIEALDRHVNALRQIRDLRTGPRKGSA